MLSRKHGLISQPFIFVHKRWLWYAHVICAGEGRIRPRRDEGLLDTFGDESSDLEHDFPVCDPASGIQVSMRCTVSSSVRYIEYVQKHQNATCNTPVIYAFF